MPAMEPASLLRFLRKLKEVFDVCDEDADGFIRVEHFIALGLQFGQGDEVSAATPAPARTPRNFHLLRPRCGGRATALPDRPRQDHLDPPSPTFPHRAPGFLRPSGGPGALPMAAGAPFPQGRPVSHPLSRRVLPREAQIPPSLRGSQSLPLPSGRPRPPGLAWLPVPGARLPRAVPVVLGGRSAFQGVCLCW